MSRRAFRLALVVVFATVGALVVAGLWAAREVVRYPERAHRGAGNSVTVKVAKGMKFPEVAATLERGGVIDLRTGLDHDGAIFLAISDNGPGIPAENIDHIFDGFFTTKTDGMGIGLSVCQSIITAHGGRIEASNHPDGGAVLRFSLPPMPDAQSPIA